MVMLYEWREIDGRRVLGAPQSMKCCRARDTRSFERRRRLRQHRRPLQRMGTRHPATSSTSRARLWRSPGRGRRLSRFRASWRRLRIAGHARIRSRLASRLRIPHRRTGAIRRPAAAHSRPARRSRNGSPRRSTAAPSAGVAPQVTEAREPSTSFGRNRSAPGFPAGW